MKSPAEFTQWYQEVGRLAAGYAVLDRVHRLPGVELVRMPCGELRWAQPPADFRTRLQLEQAIAKHADTLGRLLAPWSCHWCGGDAECPDRRCDRCLRAIRINGEALVWSQGATCWHAHVEGRTTPSLCGLQGLGGDRFRVGIALQHGSLCRRCVFSLLRGSLHFKPHGERDTP